MLDCNVMKVKVHYIINLKKNLHLMTCLTLRPNTRLHSIKTSVARRWHNRCLRNTVNFHSKQINSSAVIRLALYQDICKYRENPLALSQKRENVQRRRQMSHPMYGLKHDWQQTEDHCRSLSPSQLSGGEDAPNQSSRSLKSTWSLLRVWCYIQQVISITNAPHWHVLSSKPHLEG